MSRILIGTIIAVTVFIGIGGWFYIGFKETSEFSVNVSDEEITYYKLTEIRTLLYALHFKGSALPSNREELGHVIEYYLPSQGTSLVNDAWNRPIDLQIVEDKYILISKGEDVSKENDDIKLEVNMEEGAGGTLSVGSKKVELD